MSAEGVATDPNKTATIQQWPIPRSVKEVRNFVGLVSYYQRFVEGFALIAKLLHQLMEKNRKFEWTEECQAAFDELKHRLVSPPILAYPCPDGNYILDTDAIVTLVSGLCSPKCKMVSRGW